MKKILLFVLALILGLGSVQKMQAAAIYGVWDDTNKVFTLRSDDNCAANSGVTDWINKEPYTTATKVVFDETIKDALPTSTREWFRMEDVRMNDVPCTKVIENGVLYILRDGKMYNAQGARVK